MQKRLLSLLRFMEVGLVFYGYYSAGVYWDYTEDWYANYYETQRAARAHKTQHTTRAA